MISILQSIKKEWVDLIIQKKKTVEFRKGYVRKNSGEDTIYKVYIYESKTKGGCGKVIGHYYSRVKLFDSAYSEWAYSVAPAGSQMPLSENDVWRIAEKEGCIPEDRFRKWLNTSNKEDYKLSLFYIFDLEIYDKPKELSEFYKLGAYSYDDWLYALYNGSQNYIEYLERFKLRRAPQSWCYVRKLVDYRGA